MRFRLPDLDLRPDAVPLHRWEVPALALCAFLFLALRLPLLTVPGVQLGWHSDAALLGLMAGAILAGDWPILFWACDYLAPLTSVFAVLVSPFTQGIGPLALRLGTALEIFGALIFLHLTLRRVVGRRAAFLTTLWLCAGPAFLFKLSYAPLSAEQYFFLGSVTLWFVARTRFDRLMHWLLLGVLAGVGWWVHRGVMFAILPALVVIVLFEREAVKRLRDAWMAGFALLAGAAIGALPIVFGRLQFDQRLYDPVRAPWGLSHVFTRVSDILTFDLWELLGTREGVLALCAAPVLLVLLGIGLRSARWTRTTILAFGVLALTAAFWVGSSDAHRGAVRYVMLALPFLYAFAAAGVLQLLKTRARLLRALGIAAALLITAALFVPRWQQAALVAAGKLEQHEHWPGGFDPRPSLAHLQAGGYDVCYANVWVAHKLEWLSEPTVRFIPYRSVNRRMVESLRLAGLPGRKCFVDLEGRVRPLTLREERDARLDVLWSMHGWKRDFPRLE
jgi:hypothetical protein